jgi:gelsolin
VAPKSPSSKGAVSTASSPAPFYALPAKKEQAASAPPPSRKKEKLKLEDTNVALIGSDLDKQARLASAMGEPAWADAGKKVGMQIWRIEKFKVKVSTTPHGTFYKDDSYICLRTYQKELGQGAFKWDIHFWLGETTSLDEAGTAAYKTVELDNFLGGEPVQHREVCGSESSLFCSYFKDCGGVRLLEGGIESGFNHVKPTEYRSRLLHVKGRKNIRVVEVPVEAKSMNSGDVFILDGGMNIYQWQGVNSGMNERARAGQLCRAMDDERAGLPQTYIYREGENDPDFLKAFWSFFPGARPQPVARDGEDDAAWEKASDKRLFRLSDSSGHLTFALVGEHHISRSLLDSSDVFVFDIGSEVFAWVGLKSSADEKAKALHFANQYLKDYNRPPFLPISRILEGGENEVFENSFDDEQKAGPKSAASSSSSRASSNKNNMTQPGEWEVWDAALSRQINKGNGIAALGQAFQALNSDTAFGFYRLSVDNVGNTGQMINTSANIILTWKGPTAPRAQKVTINGNLQKALDTLTPNKGWLEVLGVKNLRDDVIYDRWKPGSGSKVIQDEIL